MKYFTPELIARLNSPDAAVASAADAEWDRRLEEYEQELRQIEPGLPEHIREFNDLLLHDARVSSLARQGDRLLMVLHRSIPPRDLVIVTYTLAAEPVIDTQALPRESRSGVMDYDYNEFGLIREGDQVIYTESILFSNGWEVQLRFHDVRFTLANPLYSTPALASVPAVSQSA
jgi:hypothetical protein